MSAMIVEEAEFVEGSINLSDTSKWYCIEHSVTVKTGQECAWCVHDQLGDELFEKWLSAQGTDRFSI